MTTPGPPMPGNQWNQQPYGQPPPPPPHQMPQGQQQPPQQFHQPQDQARPPVNQPPPAPRQPAPSAQPVVIDVGADTRKKSLIAVPIAGGIGLLAIISGIAGAVKGGEGTRITAIVIGCAFLALGLLPLFKWKKIGRARQLIFEQAGIRWNDPQGQPWAASWQELSGVAISRTVQRRVRAEDHLKPRRIMVRLDIFPGDSGFRGRHNDMEHLWEFHRVKNGYRLPLGSTPKFIPAIERGMQTFCPEIFLGIRDEGFTVGLY